MPRARSLEFGVGFQTLRPLAHEIVDLGLVGLQVGDIVLERAQGIAMGRGEARQPQQLAAAFPILVEPLLEDRTESGPDLGIGLGIFGGGRLQFADDAGGEAAADLHHLRVVLQHLARQVERQVLAVDDTAHEAQIGRQQIGIVGDVDAADIKLHPPLAAGIGEVERRARRNEEQDGVGLPAFHLVVQRQRRFVESHRDGAIGLRVVLRLDLGLRALPQGAGGIDLTRLALVVDQLDGKQDVVGVGPDNALEFEGLKVLGRLFLEMQNDLGAPRYAPRLLVAGRRHLEAGAPCRGPNPGVRRACPPARDLDAIGHHEGGIEADAELPDETETFLRVLDPLQEGLRSRTCDRSQVVDQLLAVHADPGVGDRERLGRGVGLEANGQLLVAGQQFGPGDRLVADLVQGV